MGFINFERSVPLYGKYDVAVIGGGPAGVPTYKGNEENGIPQPGTLMFEVGGMRCMPAAMAMGQAAGTAAAMAVTEKKELREIDIAALQAHLRQQNAILD